MSDTKHSIYLTTSALGFASATSGISDDTKVDDAWLQARSALQRTALEYAAAEGSLDAAERAELLALRLFRDQVHALRGELTDAISSRGPTLTMGDVRETIDAFFVLLPGALG